MAEEKSGLLPELRAIQNFVEEVVSESAEIDVVGACHDKILNFLLSNYGDDSSEVRQFQDMLPPLFAKEYFDKKVRDSAVEIGISNNRMFYNYLHEVKAFLLALEMKKDN